jgi:hypothetical protein
MDVLHEDLHEFLHASRAEYLSEREIFRTNVLKVICCCWLFNDADNIETICGAVGGMHTFPYLLKLTIDTKG